MTLDSPKKSERWSIRSGLRRYVDVIQSQVGKGPNRGTSPAEDLDSRLEVVLDWGLGRVSPKRARIATVMSTYAPPFRVRSAICSRFHSNNNVELYF